MTPHTRVIFARFALLAVLPRPLRIRPAWPSHRPSPPHPRSLHTSFSSGSKREHYRRRCHSPGVTGGSFCRGVRHLNEPQAVFETMLTGGGRQQMSGQLADGTVREREQLLRRFQEFAGSFPWECTPGDVEDFTVSLASGRGRLATGTIRGYHLTLRMFCNRCALRVDRAVPRPLRCNPVAGLPRVKHRRVSERVRGLVRSAPVELRGAATAVRLPRRAVRDDRPAGPQVGRCPTR